MFFDGLFSKRVSVRRRRKHFPEPVIGCVAALFVVLSTFFADSISAQESVSLSDFAPSAAPDRVSDNTSSAPRPESVSDGKSSAAPSAQPNTSERPDKGLSAAAVESALAELQDNPGLSDELRTQIVDQYKKASERLAEADNLAAQTQALRTASAGAAAELERLQNEASAEDSRTALPADPAAMSLEQLQALRRDLEAVADGYRRAGEELSTELERRSVRLREAPELSAAARTKVEDLSRQLAAPPAANEPAELTAAKRARIEAARQIRRREIEFIQQEIKTYDDTARLMSLRRDHAERSLKSAQRKLVQLQRILAEREQQAAEAKAAAARRAALNAHPAVHRAAALNSELAEHNSTLVASLDTTRTELTAAESARDELTVQYAGTRKQAEDAKFSQAIGMLLRSQQAELPDLEHYRERKRRRDQEQAQLTLKILEWENERRKILDLDSVVEKNLQSVSDGLGMIEQVDVRLELEQVFNARSTLYAELINNANSHLGRLAALDAAEDGLIKVIEGQATFISEHILWVRSTTPLSPSLLSPTSTAIASLTDAKTWQGVWENLKSDIKTHPIFELLLLPPIWLLVTRRRVCGRLNALAQAAQRSSATGFSPTLRAIGWTFALAAPLPSLIAMFGWRLTSIASPGEFSYALGKASLVIAGAFLALEFIRCACRENGLGDAHFGWREDCLESVRRAAALVKISCLPVSFVCLLAEFSDDMLMISTIGRIALIIESIAVASIAFELLRSGSPLARVVHDCQTRSWARHTYKIWSTALVLVPLVLAFGSAIGFHYTATRLSTRMAATWGVIALVVGLRAVSLRWLLVVYRRFAVKRAREKRALLQSRQTGGTDNPEAAGVTDDSLELRLADINDQARNIIRITTVVLGAVLLTLIWHEIWPAMGYLNRFQYWDNSLLPLDEHGIRPKVTLVDLLFGGAWMTLTILACRNLPGLLDITVYQRLPLDAGARYAASALTQYALVVIGAAVCFRQIGIGWQSVQWLVAAMTVGLGFGLQEIFANFVSGIILLFERPIRVGDTVTIGNVSGTVTRIRIRATTVLDWDNKELIVPNRDFVTGNLVNWTLSNPNLRVVINVGVAYGSDTRLVTRLLYEVAATNPLTLPDPEPVVVFSNFGDSSLDFELRVFACGLSNSRTLRHELHMALDDAFREHGIEIAFPQQDLHVRSMPQPWVDRPAVAAATGETHREVDKQAVAADAAQLAKQVA